MQPSQAFSGRRYDDPAAGWLGAMPTLVVGMLAVSLRSLGKHGTRTRPVR